MQQREYGARAAAPVLVSPAVARPARAAARGANASARDFRRPRGARRLYARGMRRLVLLTLLPATALAAQLAVPVTSVAPAVDDFLTMAPSTRVAGSLAAVHDFTQREPENGRPATERTDAYLARDAARLYVVFVCFDRQPARIRGHMTRRENLADEDQVTLYLDTFHDRQRAYAFAANPAGVQLDAIFTDGGGGDTTFDAVWQSEGRRTAAGYVVWMAIPFKSIRFDRGAAAWGVVLQRTIARKREEAFWPAVSADRQGTLTQEGELSGFAGVAPARNVQLTPYTLARAFRDIDFLAPAGPQFRARDLDSRSGVDAKLVVRNALVVDTTIRPDFSQVESDEPQVTVNQRFAVYFPEKRPFFLESSDYFSTAFADNSADFFHLTSPLLFTRNIRDPRAGVRVTGKLGATVIGVLLADDRAPGESVPRGDPLWGRSARFAVVRVARDIANGRVGAIVTEETLAGRKSTVAGVDARLVFLRTWVGTFRATASEDTFGARASGHTLDAEVVHDDRHLHYDLAYFEASPGYVQRAGFYRRPDIRRIMQLARYYFRPEGKRVAWWGPMTYAHASRDFSGLRLDRNLGIELDAKLGAATVADVYTGRTDETLRPVDFPALAQPKTYTQFWTGGDVQTQLSRSASLALSGYRQGKVNYAPPDGSAPFLTGEWFAKSELRLRPVTALSIDSSYILDRLASRGGEGVFTNQIVRTKWNYQFTRSLSLRVIAQYDSLLTNRAATSLPTTRNFNGDVLVTYMVSPGTALYVGYNGNLQNYDRALRLDPHGELLRTRDGMISDARQVFAKVSYQFVL
jgi:Domain of unknown function (DUF5916)